jgi:hypothetical protein
LWLVFVCYWITAALCRPINARPQLTELLGAPLLLLLLLSETSAI